MKNKFKELNDLLDKDISKATGIPVSELTLDKIEELLEKHDYPPATPLLPRRGKVEINRTYPNRKKTEEMRKKANRLLSKYKKAKTLTSQ